MAKDTVSTLNTSELRASIAPILNAYKGLAAVNDVLEQVLLEETRLRALTKDRTDLEQAINDLRSTHGTLLGDVNTARQDLAAAQQQHRDVATTVRTQQAQLAELQTAHQSGLDADRQAHDADIAAMRKEWRDELDRLQGERAAIMRELTAAQHQLAAFYDKIKPAA